MRLGCVQASSGMHSWDTAPLGWVLFITIVFQLLFI